MGCFWGAERAFWKLDGVYTTAVGYAGGYTENATYEEVCTGATGHTEVVLVVYDETKVSYSKLLETFWQSHDPTQGMRQGADIGTMYRSAIYCFDDEQIDQAERSRDRYQELLTAGVLLRRGLPPAVPREEPWRLLRAWRLRRVARPRCCRQRAAGLTPGPFRARARRQRIDPDERNNVTAPDVRGHQAFALRFDDAAKCVSEQPPHLRDTICATPAREPCREGSLSMKLVRPGSRLSSGVRAQHPDAAT
jgi:methionine-S-sulfoxide reductase